MASLKIKMGELVRKTEVLQLYRSVNHEKCGVPSRHDILYDFQRVLSSAKSMGDNSLSLLARLVD